MVTPSKDAAQQLYRSIWTRLTEDPELVQMIDHKTEDPRVYQTHVDFDTSIGIQGPRWITYDITSDLPFPLEQTQDVRDIKYEAHCFMRAGRGGDIVEQMAKRVNELLDKADMSTPQLFAWYNLGSGYSKGYEAQPELWHVKIGFHGVFMGVDPTQP